MNGPGVAFECVYKDGMHVWEDNYILEVIDRENLDVLPDGDYGELVFTTLCRQATPLLRYRTRDISAVYTGECGCGRSHRRIHRITGRSDDMLIINGSKCFSLSDRRGHNGHAGNWHQLPYCGAEIRRPG